jgi:hypothetical protein
MAKKAKFSFKLEPSLLEAFRRAAAAQHQSVAETIRELMRVYIANREIPNAETIAALKSVERREVTKHPSVEAMFRKLAQS